MTDAATSAPPTRVPLARVLLVWLTVAAVALTATGAVVVIWTWPPALPPNATYVDPSGLWTGVVLGALIGGVGICLLVPSLVAWGVKLGREAAPA